MPSKSQTVQLPPIPLETHLDLNKFEKAVVRDLETCWGFTRSDLNVAKAERTLRTYLVEVLNIHLKAYRKMPSYKSTWIPTVEKQSIDFLLNCWDLAGGLNGKMFTQMLQHTAKQHWSELGLSTTSRGLPKNDKAQHRMSRSIHAPRAARKVENYINQRGVTLEKFSEKAKINVRTLRRFRRDGKVDRPVFERIANAMGTTIDELLS